MFEIREATVFFKAGKTLEFATELAEGRKDEGRDVVGKSIKKECDKLFTLGIMLLNLADNLKGIGWLGKGKHALVSESESESESGDYKW